MKKSSIALGQMFIQFPSPIAELQDTPKPRVWVKVDDETYGDSGYSTFVDNAALMRFLLGEVTGKVALARVGIRDKWMISDNYYVEQVRRGKFVPIDGLREVEGVCLKLGYEMPEEVETEF